MLNPRLELLTDYPFDRLRALLDGIAPPAGMAPLMLSIGEPQHAPPALVQQIIAAAPSAQWGKYPPIDGTPGWRRAVADWLTQRYGLADGLIDADRHVLPAAGTREALYLTAALCVPEKKGENRPLVVIPNPFYQVYSGAGVMAGAELRCLDATARTGFLPDLGQLTEAELERTALMFLCSPGNPQGAVASLDTLKAAIAMARKYDFVLAMDECYAEIYTADAPPGALQACAALDSRFDNVLVFHSLSKRSSVPGLRSGFVAGDQELISSFKRLRSYAAATLPLPVLDVSEALWRDEAHVTANRDLYRAKFDAAADVFGGALGFEKPAGGFFLWLDVSGPCGNGEAAARKLWADAAIRVLPGAYLARPGDGGANPGDAYIRVALVHDLPTTTEALTRMAGVLL